MCSTNLWPAHRDSVARICLRNNDVAFLGEIKVELRMPLFGAIHNFAIGVIIFLTRVIWHFGYIRIPIQLTTLSPALVATLSITFYTRCSGGCLCTCAGVRSLMPRWDTHTYSFVDVETCLSDALCSICVSGPGA